MKQHRSTNRIIQLVQRAMAGKAPVVGIPIEGGRAFAVRRKLLVESLRGMRIVEAAIQIPLDSQTAEPYLQIICETDFCRGRRQFVHALGHADRWGQTRKELLDWADTQRKLKANGKGVAAPKAPKRDKFHRHRVEIEKLQKQLAAVDLRRPRNPFVTPDNSWSPSLEGLQSQAASWSRWKSQKDLRRKVMQLARQYGNDTKLYKAVREIGLNPTIYSKLCKQQIDRLDYLVKHGGPKFPDTPHAYLNTFWEYCKLAPKPYGFEPEQIGKSQYGPDRYDGWLTRLHARQELQSRIEAIRTIMATVAPEPEAQAA